MKTTTAWVNRAPYERMPAAMARLHVAIARALQQSSPFAHMLYRSSELDTLAAAVAWIVQQLPQAQEAQK